MLKISKIDYKKFIDTCKYRVDEKPHFEYYHIYNNIFNGYFVAYDNQFHMNHKYIHFKFDFESSINVKSVFKVIKKYFNKPLQIMIEGSEDEIISKLVESGFLLRRKSFDLNYEINDIKKELNYISKVKLIDENNYLYDELVKLAYNYYKKTHKKVSKLTTTIKEFRKVLPKEVFIYLKDEKVINYVFVEKNELCYMGSDNLSNIEEFSYTVSKILFEEYENISIEVDNTDLVSTKFKDVFKDKETNSTNTFVLKD